MADPGFLRGGEGANFQGGGKSLLFGQFFFLKTANKQIWTQGLGARPWCPRRLATDKHKEKKSTNTFFHVFERSPVLQRTAGR